MATYTQVANITLHQDTINCLAFSEDGVYLASGDNSGLLVISRTQEPTKYDKYHLADSITSLAWIPGSQSLYAGLANCDVILVFLDEERAYRLNFRPPGYEEMDEGLKAITQVSCLSFDPVHSRLAVGVGSMTIVASITNLRSNKYHEECVIVPEGGPPKVGSKPLKALPAEVRSLHFIEEGRKIIVVYLEEGIRCYSIHDRSEQWRIAPKSFRIGRAAVDSQARFLVCSNLYNGFDIYLLHEKAYHRTILHQSSEDNNVPLPVMFIHDDNDVLLGSASGQVNIQSIWGNLSAALNHGQDIIQAISFTEALDNTYIATACAEKGAETYIKLWARTDDEVRPRLMVSRSISTEVAQVQTSQRHVRHGTSVPASIAANSPCRDNRQPSVTHLEGGQRMSWTMTVFLVVWVIITFTLISLLVQDGSTHEGRWPSMQYKEEARSSVHELAIVS